MRRPLLTVSMLAAFAAATPLHHAFAQDDGGGGGGGDDSADTKKKDDWGDKQLPLPDVNNVGPCPFVKVLYDAARYVELKDNRESVEAVGYTGEIQTLSSACQYKNDDPIRVQMQVLFELGRGPQAQGSSKTYRYWVAVTDRNRDVIDKAYFNLPVTFPAGQDRVTYTDTLKGITIPRANAKVSGANFEVLVGFDVTPEMIAFNRDGKRFKPSAALAAQAQSDSATK
ncbi:MAG TPA: Tat pathway signal sequence domain protein [Caulobacteraceae bacterium]|nr:Tat pathway signal sequence domain protein [Caulobacteraceae bacterium]